ncbi:MAG: PHP domain-containing protein [Promethearchaeota archaeon]
MEFPRINLHTHTIFSDGKNSIKDMVNKALKLGLNYLAITDHFTDSWKSGIITTLNSREKIEDYLNEISECQEFLSVSNKNLRLYKGIEVDIGSSGDYIKRLIHPTKFDIIIFEYLETPEGIAFIKNLIDQWKISLPNPKSFPIIGLAHFDPSHFFYGTLDILLHFLSDYNIYFEFNSSYSQYYSWRYESFFKKLKEYNIFVAIGSDAHNSRSLDNILDPLEMIKAYDLESNLEMFINHLKQKF